MRMACTSVDQLQDSYQDGRRHVKMTQEQVELSHALLLLDDINTIQHEART